MRKHKERKCAYTFLCKVSSSSKVPKFLLATALQRKLSCSGFSALSFQLSIGLFLSFAGFAIEIYRKSFRFSGASGIFGNASTTGFNAFSSFGKS